MSDITRNSPPPLFPSFVHRRVAAALLCYSISLFAVGAFTFHILTAPASSNSAAAVTSDLRRLRRGETTIRSFLPSSFLPFSFDFFLVSSSSGVRTALHLSERASELLLETTLSAQFGVCPRLPASPSPPPPPAGGVQDRPRRSGARHRSSQKKFCSSFAARAVRTPKSNVRFRAKLQASKREEGGTEAESA